MTATPKPNPKIVPAMETWLHMAELRKKMTNTFMELVNHPEAKDEDILLVAHRLRDTTAHLKDSRTKLHDYLKRNQVQHYSAAGRLADKMNNTSL